MQKPFSFFPIFFPLNYFICIPTSLRPRIKSISYFQRCIFNLVLRFVTASAFNLQIFMKLDEEKERWIQRGRTCWLRQFNFNKKIHFIRFAIEFTDILVPFYATNFLNCFGGILCQLIFNSAVIYISQFKF